ncbi:MAG TPA: ABC transporter permease [Spirochaetales bacterium]|nr:ABC transporter permease [Spirochaetales bacterium]
MKKLMAFYSILRKDVKTYYLKPPNISWGIIFPFAWALMYFVRSKTPMDVREILPGLVTLSVLFGTTSMLSVTITFERRGRSFERLLLAPISLTLLMMAKTSGAILFGTLNGFVPILVTWVVFGLHNTNLAIGFVGIVLLATVSTFIGLFIAVAVKEVFEAQTFSNFFRFPMIFLCGLFIPLSGLPAVLRPLSYAIPVTYGVDLLNFAFHGSGTMYLWLDFLVLTVAILFLFSFSLANIKKKWLY